MERATCEVTASSIDQKQQLSKWLSRDLWRWRWGWCDSNNNN